MSLNNDNINYIKQIQFSVFSNEDIKDYSSIIEDEGIDIAETYEGGEPKRGGLVDTRLGITDGNLECAFCGQNANYCQGHPGHTLLEEPIFHYGLLSHIKNKNKDITIICLGGSINILSGYEKKTPEILNLLNLEWLWRLRFDTVRRILRLIETSYLFTKMLIFKQNKIH